MGLLTRRGVAFGVLGAVTTAAGMLLGYPDVTRIGVLLLVLLLVCVLWAWRRAPVLSVARAVLPSRLHPGERGQVVVDFRNDASRSTPLFLGEESVDVSLGDRPRFLLPRMERREVRRLQYPVRAQERGAYHLGPVQLRQRDPFGLTHVTHAIGRPEELLVLPSVEALGGRVEQGAGTGEAGEQSHLVALRGEDDASIREYRDGDEMRRVHWPATAHRGELMVRQEERPVHRRAVVLLDSRAAAHGVRGRSGTSPSYEWAVSATASVVSHLHRQGYLVHLLTETTVLGGEASEDIDEDAALALLARIRAGARADLTVLARAAQVLAAGGVLVVAVVVAGGEQEGLARVAAVRDPRSQSYALLLSQGRDAHAGADLFRASGWRTSVVAPGDTVAAAWAGLAREGRGVGVAS